MTRNEFYVENLMADEVRAYAIDKCKEYPELIYDIYGMYDLFLMEIEDGSSVEHEAELFYNDVDEIISEYKSNTTTQR